MAPPTMNPLVWVGAAKDELMEFPEEVRHDMGVALMYAQAGDKAGSAKPLKGYHGAGVLEVVENHDGNTYRAVYTVRYKGVVYVLHCFQKKSRKGIATPKTVLKLIDNRLDAAKKHYESEIAKSRR